MTSKNLQSAVRAENSKLQFAKRALPKVSAPANLQSEKLHNDFCEECGCPHEICCYSRAREEMLKEVEEKFVNHVRTKTDLLDELICKNQKQIGFPLHLHMHQLCKDLWKVSADDWKQLLRTQSGAGGK